MTDDEEMSVEEEERYYQSLNETFVKTYDDELLAKLIPEMYTPSMRRVADRMMQRMLAGENIWRENEKMMERILSWKAKP